MLVTAKGVIISFKTNAAIAGSQKSVPLNIN